MNKTLMRRGVTNADGYDLTEALDVLRLDPIPIWPERNINGSGITAAAFHSENCACGRGYGICYDLAMMDDPNETMLHELTHAWQHARGDCHHALELMQYGYWNAPHEREARKVAAALKRHGIRVWFPERMR